MATRIKYTKTNKNGWCYAIQVKKWIFWKTVETYATFEGAERFLNILKDVDNFNVKVKTLKTAVYKKPKYPTSYKECCDVLGLNTMDNDACGYKADLIIRFQELYIARDAYWKIAGEEMGLGKPWEPNWNGETDKFTISNKCNKIYLNNTAWYAEILSFPTAEMRDAFYENFKDLIENCKELL